MDVDYFANIGLVPFRPPLSIHSRFLGAALFLFGESIARMARDDAQQLLFDPDSLCRWRDEWQDMPEFVQEDLSSWKSIKVHFANAADLAAFSKLIGRNLTNLTRSIWYPEAEIGRYADKRYAGTGKRLPAYPVYIVSKGRWEARLTVKALEAMRVPFHIVIEPQELPGYATVIDRAKILTLPFSNLGQGSIPARNWIWEHARALGYARHWILDDNIEGFYRLNRNLKTPVADGAIFRVAEQFVDRYENIGQAGFNYFMFASRKSRCPPFTLNTRIYSCILIRNDLNLRWRGKYNEDTDLSLRILKAGYATVLFNTFLAGKQQTMTARGGNTTELYKDNGRREMAESLAEQHPDVARIVWKWGRWHHEVDYRQFKSTKLIRKPTITIPLAINNFGIVLQQKQGDRWVTIERPSKECKSNC